MSDPQHKLRWFEVLPIAISIWAIFATLASVVTPKKRLAVDGEGAMHLVVDHDMVLWTRHEVIGEVRQRAPGTFSLIDSKGHWSDWSDWDDLDIERRGHSQEE